MAPKKTKKTKNKPMKSQSGSKARASVTAKSAPAATDPKAAYEHFLSRASQIDPKTLPVARGQSSIASTNVDKAVAALKPHLKKVAVDAPTLDLGRITELPSLASGFVYAEKLIPKSASTGAIEKALAEIGPIRTATLSYLDAAAYCGLVDAGRVQKIRAGQGKLDRASDAVAIAGLFEDSTVALEGRHPFVAEQLATLRDTGGWLVSVLKPSGAVRDPKARHPAALIKDRFAKLVEEDYAVLLKAAVAVWGVDDYSAHVPALYARSRKAPKKVTPKDGGTAGGGVGG